MEFRQRIYFRQVDFDYGFSTRGNTPRGVSDILSAPAVNTFAAEMGSLPTWNETPLHKLTKEYRFTELYELEATKSTGEVVSKLFFDNISIKSIVELQIIKSFLETFALHIKYFKIRQSVYRSLSKLKAKKFMDFVQFCLEKLPNLMGFTLVICQGESDKTSGPNCWSRYLKHKTFDIRERHTFVNLEKLESLVIDCQNFPCECFLNYFAFSLVNSYSKQLKQFSILANSL